MSATAMATFDHMKQVIEDWMPFLRALTALISTCQHAM
jgi:hypothetical protein